MLPRLFRMLCLALTLSVSAFARAEPALLPLEQAFRLSATVVDATTVEVRFDIADGYYLYRDKLGFAAEQAALGQADIPPGKMKKDEIFGDVEVHRGVLPIRLPLGSTPETPITLTVRSQGCADAGICYPPSEQTLVLDPANPGVQVNAAGFDEAAGASVLDRLRGLGGRSEPAAEPAAPALAPQPLPSAASAGDESSMVASLMRSGNLWLIAVSFLGFGLLLSFTPCVLPMVPILSGIIVGHGAHISRTRAFALSAAYVLGMAATYALAGVAAGLSGTLLSAALQNAWVLGGFALVFVVLSLSMFGFYELQLPTALQSRLSDTANHQRGSIGGLLLMGAASALIVGPCVAAPLAGALLYIAQSGDAVLGGLALFAMALGMGVPLIAVGVASRSLLPHTGPWMEGVKRFFGVLLLATAIWIASPVLPGLVTMLAWAVLLIASSIYLHALDPLPVHAGGWHKLWKGVGVIALLAGSSLLIGAAAGSRDVLQPLAVLRGGAATSSAQPAFQPVGSTAELDARLAAATAPVMLDFYADWCVSCKEMERFTFSDPQVAAQMAGMTLLKADVTANSAEHQALLKRFGLFGPPGILFFDRSGQEIAGTRVVGFVPAGLFSSTLGRAIAASGPR
ncbi:protein-disulfide reductase DsbD [Methyloversatilis sp. XJ19-49]|uniref:protein-disulfide reductase DsbD n=1 Tax=Methyloversatilis sp. XJ19-49 TaxID=2963429 RepID=UPI00211BF686|nr:protein-disulfide reductase DsbD [Methyloversatilis sp. XJ19-49]MCQ9376997.1 protein-disulfide reductase DsbD [Methyloversatilis sp. XJ19-49]